jgi:hypothetical protein
VRAVRIQARTWCLPLRGDHRADGRGGERVRVRGRCSVACRSEDRCCYHLLLSPTWPVLLLKHELGHQDESRVFMCPLIRTHVPAASRYPSPCDTWVTLRRLDSYSGEPNSNLCPNSDYLLWGGVAFLSPRTNSGTIADNWPTSSSFHVFAT